MCSTEEYVPADACVAPPDDGPCPLEFPLGLLASVLLLIEFWCYLSPLLIPPPEAPPKEALPDPPPPLGPGPPPLLLLRCP